MVFTLAALCVLLGSAGAGAQPNPYRQYSSHVFVNVNLRQAFLKQWGAVSPRAPVGYSLSASSFRTVGDFTVPKRVAASVQSLDSVRRQELEGALHKLIKKYEQVLDQNDEHELKNNLAGAFNFLFAQAWYVFKDGQELSAAQRRNMLDQLNTALAVGLPEQRLSDVEKQDLYEAAVLSGSIILGLYNEGRDLGRQEQTKAARELARELLMQMMGITLEKVRLTDDTVRVN
ncbi:DUF6683 family protein [Archangium sp.]|uniref:DUF6683 family protein n=1 Tax=Archangium sp. TaxID=1872627 RepID=UPI00286C0FE4|nr:DUF6683 family protein [Archangium sp.]